jgi:hypothetical protein
MRGGRDNDPDFGTRMTGQGEFAELLARRFAIAKRRLGYEAHSRMQRNNSLDTSLFRVPAGCRPARGKATPDGQLSLF